ncbi:hypothetical protein Gorai_019981, partial [Gossypium raimondii]|nr:hypothetical protein [Gossypium raimondii]
VGPNGDTAIRLAISAKAVPFKFTNGLDIYTSTGMDADFLVSSSDRTGRLLKYNPYTGDASVLVADNIKRNKNGEFWVALNSERLGTITNDAPDPIGMKFNEEA